MRVRALEPDDAAALVTLRREALTTHPLSIDHVRESLATPARAAIFGAIEPRAMRWERRDVDDHHMVLDLG